MDYPDYYKLLEVPRAASVEEIRRAYRKLAMQYHPDHNQEQGSAETFRVITEAYEALVDPHKRARYDRLGASYAHWQKQGSGANFSWEDWFGASRQPGTQPRPTTAGRTQSGKKTAAKNAAGNAGKARKSAPAQESSGFSDFFRMIFEDSGAGKTKKEKPAAVHERPIQISLQEAYHGGERSIQSDGQTLKVRIPAGAKTGTRLRLANGGPQGANGRRADLHLVVDIRPDEIYQRKGHDLHTVIEIDLLTAVLGGQINVPTPGGNVALTIPPGTQPGQTFRLAGRGMPHLRSPGRHGDLLAAAQVNIPRRLSSGQRALYEKLRELK
jgi:curved DNA-binding protein